MKSDVLLSYSAFLSVANAKCDPSAIQAALPSGATVNFARPVAANGTFEVPESETGYPTSPNNLPSLCAVSVQVQSIGNTTYGFGMFLPDNWNGRFWAVGNGGYAGGINYLDMAPAAQYGFAAMSTDTGHNSSSFDASWAYQQPDKVENWGHRALHGSTVIGKSLAAAYYSQNVSYSYYGGCSTGGRQGLKEAEYYPEDFDGIIAGAPAWWTAHMQPWTVRVFLYNQPTTAAHYISAPLFAAINKEVIKQCDPQDGLVDNLISDPKGCSFRIEAMLCGANAPANSTTCVTRPQIDTFNKLYTDYIGANNTVLFPTYFLGAEGFPLLYTGDSANTLGSDYPKYMLGLGKDWDFRTYTDDIITLSDKMNPGNATVGFDLSGYHKRGGKILSYHGMGDFAIPTGSTPYYYNHVASTLAPQGIDVDSFFKFFFVPGMGHCSGSLPNVDSPWYFAGPNQPSALTNGVYSVPGFQDKAHDIVMAMMAWVEKDEVPEYIVGTKFANESTPQDVKRQRPLCMYPKEAKYKGQGDANHAANWECKSLY